MPRFFVDTPLIAQQVLDLPESVCRHIHVLRLQPGETIVLFDGRGGEFPATLDQIGKKRISVLVGEHAPIERESMLHLQLVQAISSGDRMDFTLQKSVELGVALIQPVQSERSVVRLTGDRAQKRREHWQGIVIAACEQCGRNRVPEVLPILSYRDWLAGHQSDAMRLVLSPLGKLRLRDVAAPARLVLLAGPEGGLSGQEEAAAIAAGWQALKLGERILRTETAALAAVAALQAVWGDF